MSKVHPIEKQPGQAGPDFMFWCPACKCGHAIWTTSKSMSGGGWKFNGDLEKPTITPSIKVTMEVWEPPVTPENMVQFKAKPWPQTKVTKICHSFVTDGIIHYCPDCTHALAGKSVPMEEMFHEQKDQEPPSTV